MNLIVVDFAIESPQGAQHLTRALTGLWIKCKVMPRAHDFTITDETSGEIGTLVWAAPADGHNTILAQAHHTHHLKPG